MSGFSRTLPRSYNRSDVTTFYLIRHGMTDVVGRSITGTAPGIHLNADGEAEAAVAAERLRQVRLAAVVSSPLERARETAARIAAPHALAVEIDPAFNEYEFGEWTNTTLADLAKKPQWGRFNTLRSFTRPPGGELMLDIQARTIPALLRLVDRHPDGHVAVVSHGDPVRAILLYCLGMPIDFVHRLEITTARISIVELGGPAPRVRQVNGDSAPPRA